MSPRAEAQWQAERPQQMVAERRREREMDGKAVKYTPRVGFTDPQINVFLKILLNLLGSNLPPSPAYFLFITVSFLWKVPSPPFLEYLHISCDCAFFKLIKNVAFLTLSHADHQPFTLRVIKQALNKPLQPSESLVFTPHPPRGAGHGTLLLSLACKI